ncbi:hypothetical protein BN946_scf185043.g56 [Trametes cinnabarina]|uniref:Uncharacterized protein n=1 Tax=Pycnoporus cinnabarinus TaxID=5643 RepID=A0A060SHL8_PYCCI|nr:hypothetical protein BN946_scf185043.g56 [Trametes cinnabarina]
MIPPLSNSDSTNDCGAYMRSNTLSGSAQIDEEIVELSLAVEEIGKVSQLDIDSPEMWSSAETTQTVERDSPPAHSLHDSPKPVLSVQISQFPAEHIAHIDDESHSTQGSQTASDGLEEHHLRGALVVPLSPRLSEHCMPPRDDLTPDTTEAASSPPPLVELTAHAVSPWQHSSRHAATWHIDDALSNVANLNPHPDVLDKSDLPMTSKSPVLDAALALPDSVSTVVADAQATTVAVERVDSEHADSAKSSGIPNGMSAIPDESNGIQETAAGSSEGSSHDADHLCRSQPSNTTSGMLSGSVSWGFDPGLPGQSTTEDCERPELLVAEPSSICRNSDLPVVEEYHVGFAINSGEERMLMITSQKGQPCPATVQLIAEEHTGFSASESTDLPTLITPAAMSNQSLDLDLGVFLPILTAADLAVAQTSGLPADDALPTSRDVTPPAISDSSPQCGSISSLSSLSSIIVADQPGLVIEFALPSTGPDFLAELPELPESPGMPALSTDRMDTELVRPADPLAELPADAVHFDIRNHLETPPENLTLDRDLPGASFDLPPSSPPPSSSPPPIFSSSPQRMCESPPSSSPPLPQGPQVSDHLDEGRVEAVNAETDSESTPHEHAAIAYIENGSANEAETPAKRMRAESPSSTADAPLPKRLTLAAVAKQHKKLAAPFRSPVIKGPLVQGGLHAVYATGRAFTPPPLRKHGVDAVVDLAQTVKPDPALSNKDRTANVAKQFKSPLVAPSAPSSASSSSSQVSAVHARPTIQTLQGKVQTLKQAIKIKRSGTGEDEDELERLVEKWTRAGREVAWAVWDYVKDLDPGSTAVQAKGGWFTNDDGKWGPQSGEKRGCDADWGEDEERRAKKPRLHDEDDEVAEEEPQAALQHSLGTMLRHMNIDPATLGWDEEEGDFVQS